MSIYKALGVADPLVDFSGLGKPLHIDETDIIEFNYASDLHLTHKGDNVKKRSNYLRTVLENTETFTDTLIVAGDFSNHVSDVELFCKEVRPYFKNIFATLGNHDYYIESKYKDSYVKEQKTFETLDKYGVNLLSADRGIYNIGKFKLAGDLMWYDLRDKETFKFYDEYMNDSVCINNIDIIDRYVKAVNFYEEVIDEVDVFVSHLTLDIIPKMEAGVQGIVPNCYLNQQNIRPNKIYIFGHTHDAGRPVYKKGSVFITNAFGYKINDRRLGTNKFRCFRTPKSKIGIKDSHIQHI